MSTRGRRCRRVGSALAFSSISAPRIARFTDVEVEQPSLACGRRWRGSVSRVRLRSKHEIVSCLTFSRACGFRLWRITRRRAGLGSWAARNTVIRGALALIRQKERCQQWQRSRENASPGSPRPGLRGRCAFGCPPGQPRPRQAGRLRGGRRAKQAGACGGATVKERYGSEFYQRIGAKGGRPSVRSTAGTILWKLGRLWLAKRQKAG